MIARGRTSAITGISTRTIAAFTRTRAGSNYDFSSKDGSDKWKDLLIIINVGSNEEKVQVDKSGTDVNKLADSVSTGGQKSSFSDGILTAPAYSISIFTLK
jgi:hypothetical protein